jgi:phage gp46-like protein
VRAVATHLDIALRWDVAARRFDLAVDGADLALDATAATPLIVSLGTDRRARPDDALPDDPLARPDPTLGRRRGWCGDALDAQGRRAGSLLWLLERAKHLPGTRARAEAFAASALTWLTEERGVPVSVAAEWLRPGLLALAARAGGATLELRQPVA